MTGGHYISVWTVVGLVAIENIQPGDVVYAKEAEGIEQSVDVTQDAETAPVLEVFSHEVDETYIVTIDGEDIETTAEHPFYDENGEQVEAQDLQEGDELSTEDGDTATVDSVECVHHDEPVTVYNFCVMEDHTYFVGEHGVLVHNECNLASQGNTMKGSEVVQHPETKAGYQMKTSDVVDSWDEYLGPNQTNINPIKGEVDFDRIFSADGTRSIRFGQHEMDSMGTTKFHFHKEKWIFDSSTGKTNYYNELVRIRK